MVRFWITSDTSYDSRRLLSLWGTDNHKTRKLKKIAKQGLCLSDVFDALLLKEVL